MLRNYVMLCRKHNIKTALKSVKSDMLFWYDRNRYYRENLRFGKLTDISGLPETITDNYDVLCRSRESTGVEIYEEAAYNLERKLREFAAADPGKESDLAFAPDSDTVTTQKLPDVIYADSVIGKKRGKRFSVSEIMFRPDFSPEAFWEYDYLGELVFVKKGSTLWTRINRESGDKFRIFGEIWGQVFHFDSVLYRTASPSAGPDILRHIYAPIDETKQPLVSIIIPNKDHTEDIRRCVTSIAEMTTYKNYEIIIVDNNTTDKSTFCCYDELKEILGGRLKVLTRNEPFNYSSINNFGVNNSDGEYIVLLNNDTKIISPDWLFEMYEYAKREDVGAVGACLLYEDDTIQHAGIIVGIGPDKAAVHPNSGIPVERNGYRKSIVRVQNYSAVTGACLMIEKKKYLEIGGLCEELPVAYNDVDFCLRLIKAGKRCVYTPHARLYHYESKSRGKDTDSDKRERFERDVRLFRERNKELLENDIYYNRNLSRRYPWRIY